jgi:hypothetical protein
MMNSTASFSCQDEGNQTVTCTQNEWAPYSNKNLNPGECQDIKISGIVEPGKSVDNVFNLQTSVGMQSYTQWVFWNASNVTAWYPFNSTYGDSSGNRNNLSEVNSPTFNTTWKITGNASYQGTSAGTSYAQNITPAAMPLGSVRIKLFSD